MILSIRRTFESLKAHTADDLLRARRNFRTAAALQLYICIAPIAPSADPAPQVRSNRTEIPPSLHSSQRNQDGMYYWESESCIPVKYL